MAQSTAEQPSPETSRSSGASPPAESATRSGKRPLAIPSTSSLRQRSGRGEGSPLTFRAPALLSEQLGQPIRWLVGTDVLTHDRVLLDWAGRRLVVGGPSLLGETLPLVPPIVREAAAPLGNIDQITIIDPSGASKLTDTVVRTAAEGTAIAKSLLGIDLAQLMGQLAERRGNGSKD